MVECVVAVMPCVAWTMTVLRPSVAAMSGKERPGPADRSHRPSHQAATSKSAARALPGELIALVRCRADRGAYARIALTGMTYWLTDASRLQSSVFGHLLLGLGVPMEPARHAAAGAGRGGSGVSAGE